MDLKDKVAVITGGASGSGRALAGAMARRGVKGLALVDMSEAVEDVPRSARRRPAVTWPSRSTRASSTSRSAN